VPEWQKRRAVIVDPSIWSYYTRKAHDLRIVYRDLSAALTELGIDCTVLSKKDHPIDIWIRDWAFVENNYFIYKPNYVRHLYSSAAIAQARTALNRRLEIKPRDIALILDGGNLVHNSRIAILTEKVLSDNSQFSKQEIMRAALETGFEQIVFIPIEPDDNIGHADGIVRFLQEHLLLVNDYSHSDFAGYGRELLMRLTAFLPGTHIVKFPWFCMNERVDGLWSAVGTYINFVQTGRGIVYPVFGHKMDDTVPKILQNFTSSRLRGVAAKSLARLGGVLNCIVVPY
jgi:agmatine deiminase